MDLGDGAVIEDDAICTSEHLRIEPAASACTAVDRLSSPVLYKTRSLSDGGHSGSGRRRLSPSPLCLDHDTRRLCKDDSSIGSSTVDMAPVTPRRPSSLQYRGASLQLPTGSPSTPQLYHHKDQTPTSPVSTDSTHIHQQKHLFLSQPMCISKPAPLSPKLDPSQIHASPTNILPRRSRGLDFSRAATSLHHSTLADQSSPESSPIVSGSRAAMNIPGRKLGDYGGATESSTSLWSMMGRSQEKMHPPGSLGSVSFACSDSSSSSDDNDLMDEDLDEPIATTSQIRTVNTPVITPTPPNTQQNVVSWLPGSPAMNSLLSFQHRQRPRKPPKRKVRRPFGLGFSSISTPSVAATATNVNIPSKSPPGYILGLESSAIAIQHAHARRESISWAANQLHISGSESDDNLKAQCEASGGLFSVAGRDGQRGVVRRVVTRRGNLLPKTKGFARIRAALAEENAPVESDFRREAEVVRQVLESDMETDILRLPLPPPVRSTIATFDGRPILLENTDDLDGDIMAMDGGSVDLGLSGRHKLRDERNGLKSPSLWARFDQQHASSVRTTPPHQPGPCPSLDDISMDSPQGAGSGSQNSNRMAFPFGAIFPMTASSSGGHTPQPEPSTQAGLLVGGQQQQAPGLPSAAEVSRRINSKRRCDDDLDSISSKRRAVSPGMSVHNSPIMQSPLQRDMTPWGGSSSRPGSNGGVSETKFFPTLSISSGSVGPTTTDGSNGRAGGKGRVGYQTMVDANDSITRLSIE